MRRALAVQGESRQDYEDVPAAYANDRFRNKRDIAKGA